MITWLLDQSTNPKEVLGAFHLIDLAATATTSMVTPLQYSRLNVRMSCIVTYYMFVPGLIKCSCTGIYSLDEFWIRFLIIGLQIILISTQCAFLSARVPFARSSPASPAPHHGLLHLYTVHQPEPNGGYFLDRPMHAQRPLVPQR